jgi:N6-adenosine-specific RNA methylase IME4
MMPNRYQLIAADPPWNFRNWGADKVGVTHERSRGANKHYPTMTIDDICALPVESMAAPDSVLLLWMVWTHLPEALRVIEAWGFEYKTCAYTWVKANPGGMGFFTGMGYYTRANTEACLLATRGKGLVRQAADVGQLIYSPVKKHSQKPKEFFWKTERLFGDVSRVELFARRTRPGWDAWGNEVECTAQLAVAGA